MNEPVRVLFFASLREAVGRGGIEVIATDTDNLMTALAEQLSDTEMSALREDNVRIAVNQQLIESTVALNAGDEVAFLPPVTGG